MDAFIIDSRWVLRAFIDGLPDSKGTDPSLYIDLKGNNLSRDGTLSLLTILVEPRHTVHLLDITILGVDAFSIAGSGGQTIKRILESRDIVKVFFDIRNASDALFGLYNIRVEGIEDLQLLELASRDSPKEYVNGLATCVERYIPTSTMEKRHWMKAKQRTRGLFGPLMGASYDITDSRPLCRELESSCLKDILHMPALRELYRAKLCNAWLREIEEETTTRIAFSQSKGFIGRGQHMALAPCRWLYWRLDTKEERSHELLTCRRGSIDSSDEADPGAPYTYTRPTEGQNDEPLKMLEALSIRGPRGGARYSGGFEFVFDDDC
jgi:exonuclease 3'-5' domain-containing protein 1